MTIYSYLRTSEVEEVELGSQLEEQLEKESLRLHTYALRVGLLVNEVVRDHGLLWSVDLGERPAWQALLERLTSGDSLIICTVERMFSSCEDMHNTVRLLRKAKIRLFVVEFEGDLCNPHFCPPFEKMLRVFHDLEKRRSTERIKVVKQRQRSKGRFLGGSRPFGYLVHGNGRLVENPREQNVLKEIIRMNQQGKSLRAISAEVSRPGMPISFKTVQRLLKRHLHELEGMQGAEMGLESQGN
ncbi:MAG: recombinase family protein [Pseudomonadales bacterium]|jgi:DNA invertase Pin-like site-specific DNA recombinase|nr:recombinase family protein [Pseudomonadales bacterium]